MPNRAIALTLAGLLSSVPVFGQEVRLLKEIFPRQGANPSSDPTEFVAHGTRVLVGSGAGFAVSDRSGAKIPSSPLGDAVRNIVTIGTRAFYILTRNGARGLVAEQDGRLTYLAPANDADDPTPLGNHVLFGATGELWRTDGTWQGTEKLTETQPRPFQANVRSLVRGGNTVFFLADDGRSGDELWRTDGTAAGTSQLADIRPGAQGSSIRHMVTSGRTLWFFADDGLGGDDLWVSDGTSTGTRRVAPAAAHPSLTPFGPGALYLQESAAGQTLWLTDGTRAGTRSLKMVGAATTHAVATRPLGTGIWTYFVVADTQGRGALWRTDGTVSGTTQITPPSLALSLDSGLAAVGREVYFAAGAGRTEGLELWSSDGSSTRLVADIRPGTASSAPTAITAIGTSVWFSAEDGIHGREPWISDGTSAGTRLVGNVGNWFSPELPRITKAGDRAWWIVKEANQDILWSTRGTPSTTQSVTIPSSHRSVGSNFFAGTGRVFFTHLPSSATPPQQPDLWITDGTAAGTKRLVPQAGTVRDAIDMSTYALFNGGPVGTRLWRTDGTANGTRDLGIDLSRNRNFYADYFARVGTQVYFSAVTDRLWITDGTPGGTREVTATSGFAMVSPPMNLQGRITFIDRQGRVVRTDGTNAGTTTTKIPVLLGSRIVQSIGTNSRGWFFSLYYPSVPPHDLFFYDVSTDQVTHLLHSPNNGIVGGQVLGETAIFRWPSTAEGGEPWISDGTRAGTYLLADVRPGQASSFGGWGTPTGDRYYYFTAFPRGIRTPYLYRTDGRRLQQISGFESIWSMTGPTHIGNQLLIYGVHPTLGAQLFAVQLYANTQSLGGGCGDANAPSLRISDPVLGSSARIDITGGQPNRPAVAILGAEAAYATRPRLAIACELVVDLNLPVAAVSGRTGPGGTASWRLPIPNVATLRGLSLASQAAVGSAPTALGTNVSPGVRLSVGY